MRQRTLAPVAALVFVAACASGTSVESQAPSVVATPERSPTPSPEASATAAPTGSVARITVLKVWDADGNATTTNDRETFAVSDFPPGEYPLDFEVDIEAAGGMEPQVTTVPPEGTEQMVFQIESDGEAVMATVTETRKDDSSLIGGHCYDVDTQEIVAGIQGDSVSFEVPIGRSFGCIFINTPVPNLDASN